MRHITSYICIARVDQMQLRHGPFPLASDQHDARTRELHGYVVTNTSSNQSDMYLWTVGVVTCWAE